MVGINDIESDSLKVFSKDKGLEIMNKDDLDYFSNIFLIMKIKNFY